MRSVLQVCAQEDKDYGYYTDGGNTPSRLHSTKKYFLESANKVFISDQCYL